MENGPMSEHFEVETESVSPWGSYWRDIFDVTSRKFNSPADAQEFIDANFFGDGYNYRIVKVTREIWK